MPGRLDRLLLAHRQKSCAGSKHRDVYLGCHPPQQIGFRWKRSTIIQYDRRSDCERAHQPVPHHPAECGEVEHAVVALEVSVKEQLLEVLEQCSSCSMYHALRKARGARRIEDVKRMIEGKPLEFHRAPRACLLYTSD